MKEIVRRMKRKMRAIIRCGKRSHWATTQFTVLREFWFKSKMEIPPSLPLPVVGDRVEVLWRGELHAAAVVKCHRTGEFNVVYVDGTVRTFVTPSLIHISEPTRQC